MLDASDMALRVPLASGTTFSFFSFLIAFSFRFFFFLSDDEARSFIEKKEAIDFPSRESKPARGLAAQWRLVPDE